MNSPPGARTLRDGVAERAARGKAARRRSPIGGLAHVERPPGATGPLEILAAQEENRVASLLPIRHGRMLTTPFSFYRGGAAIMASDLATTPTSGLLAQGCGDAHLSNFGVYRSPERRMVFDVDHQARDHSRAVGVGRHAACGKSVRRGPRPGLHARPTTHDRDGRRRRVPGGGARARGPDQPGRPVRLGPRWTTGSSGSGSRYRCGADREQRWWSPRPTERPVGGPRRN